MGAPAVNARKVWMTLSFIAIMTQLEVPAPPVQKDLVHQTNLNKALKCAVNSYLIRTLLYEPGRDFLLCQRLASLEQYFQYCPSSSGAPQPNYPKHIFDFGIQCFFQP